MTREYRKEYGMPSKGKPNPRKGKPSKFLEEAVMITAYIERSMHTRLRNLDLNASQICRDAIQEAVQQAEHWERTPYY